MGGLLVGAGNTSSPYGQWVAEGVWTDQLTMEERTLSSQQGRDPEGDTLRMWLPKSN
jgi:hypothetical protein